MRYTNRLLPPPPLLLLLHVCISLHTYSSLHVTNIGVLSCSLLYSIGLMSLQLRDENGSVGHGSWVKWVTIFG